MNSEKWKRRAFPTTRSGTSLAQEVTEQPNEPHNGASEGKKPRALTKALRSISSSSLDSTNAVPARSNSSVRRLQKTPTGSVSMMERLHKRVSRESGSSPSPSEVPGSPIDQPWHALEIVQHGHLKTDVSLLKARSEYLVLTDQSLVKLSSFEAAKVVFPQLNQTDTPGHRPAMTASQQARSAASEIRFEIPLQSVVAAFNEEGSSPRFGIELWWFSQWPRLAYSKAQLFFALPKEREEWLSLVQKTCKLRLRKAPEGFAVPENLKTRITHIVASTEPTAAEGGAQNLTFPVARRVPGVLVKPTSAEEANHVVDTSSFYLVIGPCMCYFLEVLKADHMMPAGDLRVKVNPLGTVTLTRFRASVATQEQRFVMKFGSPFGREVRLDLASTYYRRIIEALTKVDRILKPMWPQHLQQMIFEIKGLPAPLQLTSGNDLGGVERSLQAYCAAFQVQVPNWSIEWHTCPQPVFRLLPSGAAPYVSLQLLAIFRALRYNSFFKAISFRDVDLTALVDKKDYSQSGDGIVITSLSGWKIPEEHFELLRQAPILVQEVHSLLFASESIKSIDMTNVLGQNAEGSQNLRTSMDYTGLRKMSSELLRPMLMLMRRQLFHCHSLTMSGTPLAHQDVEELATLLGLDYASFKKLDLSKCSLGDVGLSNLWEALPAQAETLEYLDTSNNQGTVKASTISNTLDQLKAVKQLRIAGNTRIYPDDCLFEAATLDRWALEELDLSNMALNDPTVNALANHMASPDSHTLRLLILNNCGLTGHQIARLFRSMGQGRQMTLHLNANRLDEGIDQLCGAISCGYGPWSLFLQMIEFTDESSYTKLLRALTVNKSIECLSLAGSATPDAASEGACQAVADFFARNNTIRFLDISGYDAKLDEGRLGRGFSRALSGIRFNSRIEHLRVRSQMLNINIGDLAEAISGNKALHTLDCESNDFNLSNFRHLVNHLEDSTSIRYFSAFSDLELSQKIRKSVVTANVPIPTRRASVISRFRHDRTQNNSPSDGPLVQQLKHEWDAAVNALRQVLEKNQKMFEGTNDFLSPLSFTNEEGDRERDEVFSTAFGGLALQDYERRKASLAHSSSTSLDRMAQLTSVGGAAVAIPVKFRHGNARPERSYSTTSSILPLSASSEGSTASGVPTPPELDSPTDRDMGGGYSVSPETVYDDTNYYTQASPESHDGDSGLLMKSYRRFRSDPVSRIDEESDASTIDSR